MTGQFMSTDFVRQNSPGILRSRKLRHRIKLLVKTRGLNLIKRKNKPEEQNIWRHIWGKATRFQGQMETLKMAGWPNCFSVSASSFPVHPSSPKRSRSTSSFSTGRVPTSVTATEMVSAPISIPSGLCNCSVSLSFAFPNQSSCFRCSRGKNQKAELPFHWLTKRSWPQHPNKQELSKRINCLIKGLACCKHTLSTYILPLMEERTVPPQASFTHWTCWHLSGAAQTRPSRWSRLSGQSTDPQQRYEPHLITPRCCKYSRRALHRQSI